MFQVFGFDTEILPENYDSKQEFKHSTKTDEEIKKYTIEDGLDEVKRTICIMTKGQQIQKYSIYINLIRIFKEPDAINNIFPLINEDILNQEEDIQRLAAENFYKMLNEKSIQLPKQVLFQLYRICIEMLKSWNHQVIDSWLDLQQKLLDFIQYDEIVEKELIQLILQYTESSQNSTSKYIAARLLGFLADKRFNKQSFSDYSMILIEKARHLSQHQDREIRKIMATEVLYKICRTLDQDIIEVLMLEKIMELVYDSDIEIKIEAIELVFSLIDYYSVDIIKSRITSLFIELLSSFNEEVIKKMSLIIGQVYQKLESYLNKNSNQVATILNNFKDYSKHKNEIVRMHFLYNLPGILALTDQKQFDQYKSQYQNLTLHDKSNLVQKQGAIVLNEIIKIIGPQESNKLLKEMIKTLIVEIKSDALPKFLHFLQDIIQGLWISEEPNEENLNQNFTEYFECLIKLSNSLLEKYQWNYISQLLEIFFNLIQKNYFKINELNDKLFPHLCEIIKKGAIQTKFVAAKNLVIIIKINVYPKKRQDQIKFIQDQLYRSSTYQMRILFIDTVSLMTTHFSRNFLKLNNFIYECMTLSQDKIPNVRIKLIENIYELRKYILKDDDLILKRFQEAIEFLTNDKDKFAQRLAKEKQKLFSNFKQVDTQQLIDLEIADKKKLEYEDKLEILQQKYKQEADDIGFKKKATQDFDSMKYLDFNGNKFNKKPKNKTNSQTNILNINNKYTYNNPSQSLNKNTYVNSSISTQKSDFKKQFNSNLSTNKIGSQINGNIVQGRLKSNSEQFNAESGSSAKKKYSMRGDEHSLLFQQLQSQQKQNTSKIGSTLGTIPQSTTTNSNLSQIPRKYSFKKN